MRLSVDCAFADFIDCDLISIALVTDDGRELYGERSDFDDGSCNAVVREAVLPQLGQHADRYSRVRRCAQLCSPGSSNSPARPIAFSG